jgi:hypothetical protein
LDTAQEEPSSEEDFDDDEDEGGGGGRGGGKSKRVMANRQSAQRSRMRKLQFISDLEHSVARLQVRGCLLWLFRIITSALPTLLQFWPP